MRKLKVSGDLSRSPIHGRVPKSLDNQCEAPELKPHLYFLKSSFVTLPQSSQHIARTLGSLGYPTIVGLVDLGTR